MVAKGLNWEPSYYGYAANTVLKQIYTAGTQPVFYNYRTTIQEVSIQGVATLNNIRFHKAKSNIAIYLLGGFGFMTYSTLYNALDANGQSYAALYQQAVAQFGPGGFGLEISG